MERLAQERGREGEKGWGEWEWERGGKGTEEGNGWSSLKCVCTVSLSSSFFLDLAQPSLSLSISLSLKQRERERERWLGGARSFVGRDCSVRSPLTAIGYQPLLRPLSSSLSLPLSLSPPTQVQVKYHQPTVDMLHHTLRERDRERE